MTEWGVYLVVVSLLGFALTVSGIIMKVIKPNNEMLVKQLEATHEQTLSNNNLTHAIKSLEESLSNTNEQVTKHALTLDRHEKELTGLNFQFNHYIKDRV